MNYGWPVNFVILLTDGFGSLGGIAKFNRDFMQALDAARGLVSCCPKDFEI
jgi:hypothetical protein